MSTWLGLWDEAAVHNNIKEAATQGYSINQSRNFEWYEPQNRCSIQRY
ncbi:MULTISPECIES: hypothetical protein [Anoxybacillus]|uniref:Uncharacterized protein n=1 Tax=Anoxybacteroides rupiense TaxID=311460 RepID=A0ABD5IRT9_9BACL|nr:MULTISPECIES: hypothetical protein [Anoxybacillus]MBB3907229.1 hypothetical protein [Anoxybacillus rupiensis]MBS2771563.1 hypothetical protein [Anoxybacillus rupiensis]MDE8562780.1 hypothetical protein [Anoxybacillus rupiensis]MED5051000.1 hypothetical protein [Anoxybacillus rupiensis]QHC04918.1 hypothetical protein GRQ40_13805 [Anoxybacillus sp. PDR2]